MALIESEVEQLALLITQETANLENLIMATKADLEAALTRLGTNVDGVKADVTQARTQLTAMQGTLDRFVAEDATEDAAFQSTIDDLKRQLAEAGSTLDGAVSSINAMADAVAGTQKPA